jgi:hypothetical protein
VIEHVPATVVVQVRLGCGAEAPVTVRVTSWPATGIPSPSSTVMVTVCWLSAGSVLVADAGLTWTVWGTFGSQVVPAFASASAMIAAVSGAITVSEGLMTKQSV